MGSDLRFNLVPFRKYYALIAMRTATEYIKDRLENNPGFSGTRNISEVKLIQIKYKAINNNKTTKMTKCDKNRAWH